MPDARCPIPHAPFPTPMRQFFKFTFASVLGNLLATFILFGLSIGGLVFLMITIASSTKENKPVVKEKSVLVFDLSVNIRDTDPVSSTGEALSQALLGDDTNTLTLRTVLDTLNQAQKDPQIVGLFLDGSKSLESNGLANLREVRQALEQFRKSGKPIIAYDMDWGEQDYYLGSVANQVYLNPIGSVELNGFSSEMMFLGGAFRKYGIDVQAIRVGKYKAAVEPFLLTKLSPENRQQLQALLDDLWGDFRASVGRHRQLSPQRVQQIADSQAMLTAEEAKQQGLVDQLVYADQVITELKKITGQKPEDKSFTQISVNKYAKVIADRIPTGRSANSEIALVYAEGEIVDGKGTVDQIGSDRFTTLLRRLRTDSDVKAVVLRVNSPGGSATAAAAIGREVALLRQAKPVIVSMGNYAASGGYWISMESDRIFAEPTTIAGSIGVFGLLLNVQKLANDNGITWDSVKTGRFADINTISRPKTPQELAQYQASVNRIYQRFIGEVAKSRNLPLQKVETIAQGRVWSGQAAKGIGLVDEIGGLDQAIAFAAQQAKLGNNWKLEEYPKIRTLEDRLVQRLAGGNSTTSDPVSLEFQRLQQELSLFTSLNDPLGVYARLPFNLRIR